MDMTGIRLKGPSMLGDAAGASLWLLLLLPGPASTSMGPRLLTTLRRPLLGDPPSTKISTSPLLAAAAAGAAVLLRAPPSENNPAGVLTGS
jgi:hypothetical protein